MWLPPRSASSARVVATASASAGSSTGDSDPAGRAASGSSEIWLARVAATRPDLALDPARAVLTTWVDDPWARCAYLAESVARDEEMSRAVGPLHFAGEHTAGEWAGLMEGALRSGRRAAEEVCAQGESAPVI